MLASTKVFTITELVSLICAFTKDRHSDRIASPKDTGLAALAQTNRLISEIALDELWSELQDPAALVCLNKLYCHPYEGKRVSERRDLTHLDGETPLAALTFLKYLPRVKKLGSQSISLGWMYEDIRVKSWTFHDIVFNIPVPSNIQEPRSPWEYKCLKQVFPNLVEADFVDIIGESLSIALPYISGSKLRKLRLYGRGVAERDSIQELLQHVVLLFPDLITLVLAGQFNAPVSKGLLECLPHLTQLQELHVSLNCRELDGFLAGLEKGHWNLTSLRIDTTSCDKEQIQILLEDLAFLISRNGPLGRLAEFKFRDDLSRRFYMKHVPSIKFEILEPFIIAASGLRRLELWTRASFDFDDLELERLGEIMGSNIEWLHLAPSSFTDTPKCTPVGIARLVALCPRLQGIGILFNATSLPTIPLNGSLKSDMVVSNCLEYINVGYSLIRRRVASKIGGQFKQWFPNIERLDWAMVDFDHEGKGLQSTEQVGWKRVKSILQACKLEDTSQRTHSSSFE